MNLLLDTHVLIWVRAGDPRLPDHFRTAIAEPTNKKFISAITAAEIAVKTTVGKLQAPAEITRSLEHLGFDELPFTHQHAQVLASLPLLHRDPFDRMLIAQALADDLTFLSVDSAVHQYKVKLHHP